MQSNRRTRPLGARPKSIGAGKPKDISKIPGGTRELTDPPAGICPRCSDQPLCHHCGQPLDRAPVAIGLIATVPASGCRFTFDGHGWRELEVAA